MSTEKLKTALQDFDLKGFRKPRQQTKKTTKKVDPRNIAPGTIYLQVLGNGSFGAPKSVYLFTDKSRYLFNCGEGTQRLAHEHKIKLARLERIFVTRNTWPTIGGIPGLTLTIQDAGVRELCLHGPPHLKGILDSMKRFVVLRSLQISTSDATETTTIEDTVMKVKCVPIFRANSTPINNCDRDQVVVAYVCKLKQRLGALNLEKCLARGVKPGRLFGKLKSGMDITLDDGTLVKSSDVTEPPEEAFSFVFLDIPSEEFLPKLQEKFSDLYDDSTILVIHFSPAKIIENNCFQNLIQKLPERTQHLYLNSSNNYFSGYVATQRLQYHLNLLNPRIFPLLSESIDLTNNMAKKYKKFKVDENINEDMEPIVSTHKEGVKSLTHFHLRPLKGFDRSMEPKFKPTKYIGEIQALKNVPKMLQNLKRDMSLLPMSKKDIVYPKITFLGTGSCVPNKSRNVSAILLQLAADSYILLDCGEGTLGQIVRLFGRITCDEIVRNLRVIYVSHLHADHHIGLIELIHERQRLLGDDLKPKMLLFAPRQIQPWLHFYNTKIACIGDAFHLIGNREMLQQPLNLAEKHPYIRLDSIQTCLVLHCPHSFGVRLTLKRESEDSEPISITYSGDTMPCEDLVRLGQKTTILIHEATMEDDLVEEAREKLHSTISEAVQQGRKMAAEHIILTHFSQRYAKLPRMRSSGDATIFDEEFEMHNVAIAFDNMHITLSDLESFHILYPTLRALFAEHAVELEERAFKREINMERKRKFINAN